MKSRSFSWAGPLDDLADSYDKPPLTKEPSSSSILNPLLSYKKTFEESLISHRRKNSPELIKEHYVENDSAEEAKLEKDIAKHIHGNLSCVLPMVDTVQTEELNSACTFFFLFTSLAQQTTIEFPNAVLTPAQVRLIVLEWLYEEKDVEMPQLALRNITVLTDLIPAFVSVVLFGKSDYIRTKVWTFLLHCCTKSNHFAFLVICSLQSNQLPRTIDSQDKNKDLNVHKNDASQIENLVEENLKSVREEILTVRKAVSNKFDSEEIPGILNRIEDNLASSLKALDLVKNKHVMRHIQDSARIRNSRANVEYLISLVKQSLMPDEFSLEQLNQRLSFIKTLTDLNTFLRLKVPREQRLDLCKQNLKLLNEAIKHQGNTDPSGVSVYFPVSNDSALGDHRLLNLVIDETIVFNTAQKCPFLIFGEIQDLVDSNLVNPKFEPRRRSTRKSSFDSIHPGDPFHIDFPAVDNNSVGAISTGETRTEKDHLVSIPLDEKEEENVQSSLTDREKWEDLCDRIASTSAYSVLKNYRVTAMYVKSGDDLRQQQLGVMLMSLFQKIFLEEKVFVKLFPYKVIPTGPTTGLLEPAKNGDSLARLKEKGGFLGADQWFFKEFGSPEQETPGRPSRFAKAQENFLRSLAGYSIVSYLIKLHDRHNGNILIDTEGHFLHIDFGFMLGYGHKLERSPFKLTTDFVNILGGSRSKQFMMFRKLMEEAFIAANAHWKEVFLMVKLMSVGSSSLCFAGGRRWVFDELKARFCPELNHRQLRARVNELIDISMGNYTTQCYDRYQLCVNGIF
eukprot:maker-scaffold_6-snap-gene-19.41-mRNA-1 protein AED:0.13 eAED:0.13 QI:0/1/0.66/1/1/1/3/157/791